MNKLREKYILQDQTTMTRTKHVYKFGNGTADGDASMKALLGGKGANLAEMCSIGIPVPPGFTITTEVCTAYSKKGKSACLGMIKNEVEETLQFLEESLGKKFGDPDNPLLLSVRSGARASMPGMMDTVLNLGLNDQIVETIALQSNNPRFAWDSYRRLIQMYGDVVLGLKSDTNSENPFELIMEETKTNKELKNDNELSVQDLKNVVAQYKTLVKSKTGKAFPADPWEQLWGSIFAVFESWNNSRAELYRSLNNIPFEWGTAVNVQAMVFGNLGTDCATGVAFTRNAATGEDLFNGEFLVNAQGEDVVAGIRTPQQISLVGSRQWAKMMELSEEARQKSFPSLEELMPESFAELLSYETKLENHYRDMQDLEFTIQEGKLWILQTRNGKRTSSAMVKIAMDMLAQDMIDAKQAIMMIDPERLNELLHPVFEEQAMLDARVIGRGLPASPGAATGQIVFFADDAENWSEEGKQTILVRQETSPEDLKGMHMSNGILTSRGGMTSHAAIVARGMGKCCIAGADDIIVNYQKRTLTLQDVVLNEGDWISLNGSTGEVYMGKIGTKEATLSNELKSLLDLSEKHSKLDVRANADTALDAKTARIFGANGIGLARTEHMFFEADQIMAMREMILANDEVSRLVALKKILPIQRSDFEELFKEMDGFPVTIRLLDPPLHEFLPHEEASQQDMATRMNISLEEVKEKVEALSEANPMLGHRGCRLGITFPEITAVQTQAILEAALNVKKEGIHVFPEIMVPLIGRSKEFIQQEKIIRRTANQIFEKYDDRIDYHVGTMIEVPRAALTADLIAEHADFFSFGTNDLTQLTFGFSRDDISKFLPTYKKEKIIDADPFEQIDENGVGRLVKYATKKGRMVKPNLSIGACGEHGGNPESVDFFHRAGLDYVSCSPYRVPIARVAAAQSNIRNEELK